MTYFLFSALLILLIALAVILFIVLVLLGFIYRRYVVHLKYVLETTFYSSAF